MNGSPSMNESPSRSFGRTAVAVLVLLVGAWLLLHFVIGILSFVFSTLLLVVAVVAVLWALKVLL
jgi:membrane protein required for beta-lactamase induction